MATPAQVLSAPPAPDLTGRRFPWLPVAAPVLLFAVLGLVLGAVALVKPLDHDEQMYVAAGALLGRGAGLPYRDYPFFQMPGLALVYAGAFLGTDDLLLAGRLLNVLAGLGGLAVLFALVWRRLPQWGIVGRLLVGTAAVLLVVGNGPVTYASGLAWNHDLPVLLTLLALACMLPAGATANRLVRTDAAFKPDWWGWQLVAGALLGLAVSTRLAFAPALPPFLLVASAGLPITSTGRWKSRLARPGPFLAGLLLGVAPTLALAALAPQRFLFDNVVYHFWNVTYWAASGQTVILQWPDKLRDMRDLLLAQPACLLLLVLYILCALPALVWIIARRGWRKHIDLVLATALVPCLLAGALAPSPTWYQYFYAPVPFMALSAVLGLGVIARLETRGARPWGWTGSGVLALGAIAALINGEGVYAGYLHGGGFTNPARWVPVQTYQIGIELRRLLDPPGRPVATGRVLTLMPLYPLEGGLEIYPGLAAGPFGWRVAPLLPAADHVPLQLAGPDDLTTLIGSDAPAAVLTGGEGALDAGLTAYAQAHAYHPARLSNGFTLWLK